MSVYKNRESLLSIWRPGWQLPVQKNLGHLLIRP